MRDVLCDKISDEYPLRTAPRGVELPHLMEVTKMSDYKMFVCVQCGFEYDEVKGWPEDGIAPGTRWDDIPDDWSCPDCGAAKSDFEMVEVARS